MAKCGCSKCTKVFETNPENGVMCYGGGFNTVSAPRKEEDHRAQAFLGQQQVSNAAKQRVESLSGSRFTSLMHLEYFDCIRFHIIDAMHYIEKEGGVSFFHTSITTLPYYSYLATQQLCCAISSMTIPKTSEPHVIFTGSTSMVVKLFYTYFDTTRRNYSRTTLRYIGRILFSHVNHNMPLLVSPRHTTAVLRYKQYDYQKQQKSCHFRMEYIHRARAIIHAL